MKTKTNSRYQTRVMDTLIAFVGKPASHRHTGKPKASRTKLIKKLMKYAVRAV